VRRTLATRKDSDHADEREPSKSLAMDAPSHKFSNLEARTQSSTEASSPADGLKESGKKSKKSKKSRKDSLQSSDSEQTPPQGNLIEN